MSDLPKANCPNSTFRERESVLHKMIALIIACYFYYLFLKAILYFFRKVHASIFPPVQTENDLKKEIEKNNKLKDEITELKYKLEQAEGKAARQ